MKDRSEQRLTTTEDSYWMGQRDGYKLRKPRALDSGTSSSASSKDFGDNNNDAAEASSFLQVGSFSATGEQNNMHRSNQTDDQ